jgi:radical SAM protein with 4Fe4S-binding SPASM domain
MVDNSHYIMKDRESMYSPQENRMDADQLFSTLMTIDLLATELCNRTCNFCPRAHGYPNLNLHMSLKTIDKIASDLSNSHYQNRILYSSFGESLLYKHLIPSIKLFKKYMPWQENIQIVTSGDRLTYDTTLKLIDAGINKFFISLYDGPEQADHFQELFLKVGLNSDKYILQHYYKPPEEDYGFLGLSNRAGNLPEEISKIETLKSGCNMPFYEMSIHWNGDVLLCSHDWEKKQIMGNVMKQSMQDIWFNSKKLWEFRNKLKDNRNCHPCNKCNIKGVLYGNKSKEIILNYQKSDLFLK